jgi:CRISPR-associated protein Cmr4
MCAASGLKGAVREWFERRDGTKGTDRQGKDPVSLVFGPENGSEYASSVSFGDARILLFPVKSAKGVFAWVTCPLVFNRFLIEMSRAGYAGLPNQLTKDNDKAGIERHGELELIGQKILLEENVFEISENLSVSMKGLGEWVAGNLLPRGEEYKFWRDSVPSRLIILPDDDFKYFVKHSTEVNARIKLSEKKTTDNGGNLFYEENLPPESLLYAPVFASRPRGPLDPELKDADSVVRYLKALDGKRMQLGGDETVGRGIMNVRMPEQGGTK